ncbi:hypothetical protein K469DRAFT_124191 [Zopfia rhizophila CBS 207.26]|uniref:Uncharacterized protein n=1 Tax=Zopfia rhizophila CBS 207.26 TaxID=1314779 RepID=A0A6A6E8J7_9PEZI|nr:hypothetical protein K469DRAFT_124191 [Zopfia rhizophila CBS 207.26]
MLETAWHTKEWTAAIMLAVTVHRSRCSRNPSTWIFETNTLRFAVVTGTRLQYVLDRSILCCKPPFPAPMDAYLRVLFLLTLFLEFNSCKIDYASRRSPRARDTMRNATFDNPIKTERVQNWTFMLLRAHIRFVYTIKSFALIFLL